MEYKVGSLFSGIGGMALGFERAGFKTAFFVENEPFCQKVLKQNFQGVKIYGDIKKVQWNKVPKCDILEGGFPCQDISVAGKGQGIEKGKRSSLWKYYKKAISDIRPKVALIENVPALLNRGLHIVLADLAQIGYDAEWFCLRASEIGALHRRERIFIIAYSCEFIRHANNKTSSGLSEDEWGKGSNGEKDSPLFITDNWGERIQRFLKEQIQREQGFSWCKDVRRVEDLHNRQDIPGPLFCGSRDGIPNWVDRIKGCGNAVVPQVAEFIAIRIREVLEGASIK